MSSVRPLGPFASAQSMALQRRLRRLAVKRIALVVMALTQATLVRASDPSLPLPSGAIARLRVPDRFAVVLSVAFSPDGKMLASAHLRSAVRLWEVASGKEIRTLNHVGAVRVCFSPDGKVLASAAHDNGIFLWDAATGDKIRTLKHRGAFVVAFSPDGVSMASCAMDGSFGFGKPPPEKKPAFSSLLTACGTGHP